MENKPRRNYLDRFQSASQFPGQHFDENRQCEFVFGNGSKICSYMVTVFFIFGLRTISMTNQSISNPILPNVLFVLKDIRDIRPKAGFLKHRLLSTQSNKTSTQRT